MEYQERNTYNGGTEIVTFEREVLELQARVAVILTEKWGAVAAEPDGEDSAGRQKLKMQDPKDLAKRACAVSEALWSEFNERNWILKLPAPKQPSAE